MNGVWKWMAGLLAAALMSSIGTYMAFAGDRVADKERLVKVEQAIIYLAETVKEIREEQKDMREHHYYDEHVNNR